MVSVTKCCTSCKQLKPYSEFFKDSTRTDGYQYVCRNCKTGRKNSFTRRKSKQKGLQGSPWQKMLWTRARNRALRRNQYFDLIPTDIVIPDVCLVSGKPFISPSLDRVDNSKGYTKDNVRVIEQKLNFLKGSNTIETLEAILAYMKKEWPKI